MPSSTSPARIAVIGAGAIGGLVTAYAHEAGHDVTLCVRTPLDELTVRIADSGETLRTPVRALTDPEAVRGTAPADWVFLTTKAQDTAGAAPWLAALCGPDTTVAVVQNGVDHAERVGPLLPQGTGLPPVLAYVSAERTAPGHILHHAAQDLHVPAGEAADRLHSLLDGTRMNVRSTDDFTTALWRKMFTNVAANPLTAILQQRLGIFQEPDMDELGMAILREAAAVARAEGAEADEEDARRTLRMYAHVPTGGTSMLYDRLAGRPLEHEHITGAVVRAGERHGIDTPLNRMLLTLLRALDRGQRGGGANAA